MENTYIIIKYEMGENNWLPLIEEDEMGNLETLQWQELKDAQRYLREHGLWSMKYKFVQVTVREEDIK